MSLPQLVIDGDIEKVRYALTQLSTEEINNSQRLNGFTVLMLATGAPTSSYSLGSQGCPYGDVFDINRACPG